MEINIIKKSIKILLVVLLMTCSFTAIAQTKVQDFKTKSSNNETERTIMLDLLRNKMKQEFNQDFTYSVLHFKVGGNYAWLKANALRKDGKKIQLDEDIPYDCCHVEALYQKVKGKWKIVEQVSFSSDVWYIGLQENYPKAPKAIFN